MPIVPHHWVENGEVELALGGGISRTGTGTGEQRYDTTAQTTLQWTLSVSMEPEDSGIEIEVGEEITIRIDKPMRELRMIGKRR